ncbi:hypothetical protein N9N06_04165 [Aquiluna sp.]|nr:hypothetical protein [Aquiluna sp.]
MAKYASNHSGSGHLKRLGIGAVLHITPSNIPLNFAYSWMNSFIAGNISLVRLPSADFKQLAILIDLIHNTFSDVRYRELENSTLFFRSERSESRLLEIAAQVQGLVVWGSDATVDSFRKAELAPSLRFLSFPDRVSSLVVKSSYLLRSAGDEASQIRLMKSIYNDTFMVDCNACSSPSQIIFVGDEESNKVAIEEFASQLRATLVAQGYEPPHVARLLDSLDRLNPKQDPECIEHFGAGVHFLRVRQGSLTPSRKLRYGVFAVHQVSSIGEIESLVRSNEQTITHIGLSEEELSRLQHLLALSPSRIVPAGFALDMDFYWEGYDIPLHLAKFAKVS